MKKTIKTLLTAAALTCCMAVPAFAASTKQEFKTEAAPVREELKSISQEMQQYHTENKAVSAAFKAVKTANKESKKNGGGITVDAAKWKQARELKKEIAAIRAEMKPTDGQVKALHTNAKADTKAGNYDGALDKLKESAEIRKDRLEYTKQINAIWSQIDTLLS